MAKKVIKQKKSGRKKKQIIQSVKGMNDVLPHDQVYWDKIRETVKSIATFYNFNRIDTPVLERIELFKKGIGEGTDIVDKEMYSLKTKGGDNLVLRPEGTASTMRAYLEHRLSSRGLPVRLFYIGPMFRHEKPQKGRFRQHTQAGFEVIGDKSAAYDAQVILVVYQILKELKIKNILVHVNSIGCKSCRGEYRTALKSYYKNKLKKICGDCKNRYAKNPLRLLDCKNEKDIEFRKEAPVMIDALCEPCRDHFRDTLEFIEVLGIPYNLDLHLVRGLDYYSRTVFEIFLTDKNTNDEGAKNIALASGGRYDYLAEQIGGRHAPGVGMSLGFERIVEYMKQKKSLNLVQEHPKAYIVQLGELARRKSLLLMERFRKEGMRVGESLGKDSLKAQLRLADKMGAEIALLIGQREAHEDSVIIRDMRSGSQETITIDKAVKVVKKKLTKKRK